MEEEVCSSVFAGVVCFVWFIYDSRGPSLLFFPFLFPLALFWRSKEERNCEWPWEVFERFVPSISVRWGIILPGGRHRVLPSVPLVPLGRVRIGLCFRLWL